MEFVLTNLIITPHFFQFSTYYSYWSNNPNEFLWKQLKFPNKYKQTHTHNLNQKNTTNNHTHTQILTLKLIYRIPFNLFTLTFCSRLVIHQFDAMYAMNANRQWMIIRIDIEATNSMYQLLLRFALLIFQLKTICLFICRDYLNSIRHCLSGQD